MKRIIILLFVTFSLAAISAPTDSVQKTVTLTQEQLDQLLQDAAEADQYKYIVQEAVKEATDQLRSEMESRYNTYVTHVGNNMTLYTGALGLFGVYLTMLIALAGILVPMLINKKFEKSIEEKIDNHDKEIVKAQNTANEIAQQVQSTANEVNKSLNEIREIKSQIKNLDKQFQEFKEATGSPQYTVIDNTTSQTAKSTQSTFNQALNEKDLDKQIELYTKAIELNPYFAEAYNNRGVAYGKKGDIPKAIKDLDDAIKYFDKAIKQNSQSAEAYNNRGNAYRIKGDFDQAIENYDQAIKLKPNYAEAYCNRGIAYRNKGDFDNAIKNYDEAIKLNSTYASAYFNRGIAYANKGDFVNVFKNFDKVIELDPNNAEAYYNRALCYILLAEKETDKAKAKEYYQKAWDDCDTGLSLNPDEEVRKALEEKKRLCEERLKNL